MSKTSGIFDINLRERVKTLLIIVIGAIGTALYQAVSGLIETQGSFPTSWPEWQPIIWNAIATGISAGATYFGVTFVTNSNKPNAIEKVLKKDDTPK